MSASRVAIWRQLFLAEKLDEALARRLAALARATKAGVAGGRLDGHG